jgi:hypothetical protein
MTYRHGNQVNEVTPNNDVSCSEKYGIKKVSSKKGERSISFQRQRKEIGGGPENRTNCKKALQ